MDLVLDNFWCIYGSENWRHSPIVYQQELLHKLYAFGGGSGSFGDEKGDAGSAGCLMTAFEKLIWSGIVNYQLQHSLNSSEHCASVY